MLESTESFSGGYSMFNRCLVCSLVVFAAVAVSADGETLEQKGRLSGYANEPEFHDIVLEPFNPTMGWLQLNFVQLDFLTAVIGGGTAGGGGPQTHIYAQLDANYFLDEDLLAETQAVIDMMVSNGGSPHTYSVFGNDSAQVIIDQPEDFGSWLGDGVVLTGWTDFTFWEDPPGSTGFSAGGTVRYTVIYDYDVAGEVLTYQMPIPADNLQGTNILTTLDGPAEGLVTKVSLELQFQPSNGFNSQDLAIELAAPIMPESSTATLSVNGPIDTQPGIPSLWELSIGVVPGSGQAGVWGQFIDSVITVQYVIPAACPADFDGDLSVGAADLAQLLGSWGPCVDCPADLNNDGIVNAVDLAQLLGNWGPCE
jgi:hypothetical protein